MLLLYPGELYKLLGASHLNFSQSETRIDHENINVNDSQNLAFATSHFVIELLPFDYLSNQKKCKSKKKNAFQEE
jgi:hypothetical protein